LQERPPFPIKSMEEGGKSGKAYMRYKMKQFKFRLSFFLLSAFFIVLFCILGNWQLNRYQEKKALVLNYQQRTTAPAEAFSSLADKSETELQFRKITVTGVYINALTILVQNQFYHDQLGYEVLTPLKMKNEKNLLLIDRGWIAKPKDNQLPVFDEVTGEQQVTGYIKTLNDYHFILGKNSLDVAARPLILQKVDVAELNKITHDSFYPMMLRLDASQPHGFVRDWVVVNMLPQRHLGYAIQWFLMALVLLIAYASFSYERTKKND
jgi:surfeit locus 1 family protein